MTEPFALPERSYTFDADLWLYPGPGCWHFVTLPADVAGELDTVFAPAKRGFGSLRVSASTGGVAWQTSVFPDKQSASYLLPVKADVRRRAKVEAGDTLTVTLQVSA